MNKFWHLIYLAKVNRIPLHLICSENRWYVNVGGRTYDDPKEAEAVLKAIINELHEPFGFRKR